MNVNFMEVYTFTDTLTHKQTYRTVLKLLSQVHQHNIFTVKLPFKSF